ncbi:hypothetical protein VB711_04285 [Cronbergia sp. UHCC 0137]|uniref:hypothetical protein n=1 Tax=Cronbergia sp. UHCC 0137 TaxID=3110239 RepID=UPI002B2181DC|nr:hypothetical protein [Cronbergia sp. UHCC 0137]MEA5617060.1 hypothetical protein [Cronbergia sp. UHCC 0137]
MSVTNIKPKSALLLDLSTDEQQVLTGGISHPANIMSDDDSTMMESLPPNMPPGATLVVPNMLYSVPSMAVNTLNPFGQSMEDDD